MSADDSTAMRLFPRDDSLARGWEDLGAGVPSLIALAKQASIAMVEGRLEAWQSLSTEAQVLLYAARERGAYEVKAVNSAFTPNQRWLAVSAEQAEDHWLTFRPTQSPEAVVRFFAGFSQLCSAGLVMHQIYRDFSLTPHGFEAAREVDPAPLQSMLDAALHE